MTPKKTDSKKDNSHMALGVGIATTVAAAALSAYFLYGTKQGAKKRAQIKGWTLKMKGEVLDRLEKVKDVNEVVYTEIVDAVAKGFSSMKNVDTQELAVLTATLKKYWSTIQKEFKKPSKKSKK